MTPQNSLALFTDLYELTMAASYFQHRMFAPATFSLFVRQLPPNRGFLVAAGLAEVVRFLEGFAFSTEDLEFLRQTGRFQADFLDYLTHLHFTGEVYALPEGRICFAHEPLLEIAAPIIEAQLVETFVLNAIHLQTRSGEAAPGVPPARVIPLLERVMDNGRLLRPLPLLSDSRALFLADFAKLPEACKALHAPALYPVTLTPTLAQFQDEAVARLRARYGLTTAYSPLSQGGC